MSCKPYENKWKFKIKPAIEPDNANQCYVDMTKITYTTQGVLSHKSQYQKYAKKFEHQCKHDNIPQYPTFTCPQKCTNKFTPDYLASKLHF